MREALIALIFAASTTGHAQMAILDTATNLATGHIYYLLANSNWTDAENQAIAMGGHLITVDDETENNWVADLWGANRSLWIGYNDAGLEGQFEWASGEHPGYENWAPGEPNDANDGEDYAFILAGSVSGSKQWNDHPDVAQFSNHPDQHGVVELSGPLAPVFTLQPEGATAFWGGSITFESEAVGIPEPGYLWYQGYVPIPWATNSSLTLTHLTFNHTGSYWVIASNEVGTAASDPALLIVNPAGVSLMFHPVLLLEGTVGKTLGIQYATNISPTTTWITLTNVTLSQPIQTWIDESVSPTHPTTAGRFYRVVAIPGP